MRRLDSGKAFRGHPSGRVKQAVMKRGEVPFEQKLAGKMIRLDKARFPDGCMDDEVADQFGHFPRPLRLVPHAGKGGIGRVANEKTAYRPAVDAAPEPTHLCLESGRRDLVEQRVEFDDLAA